MGQGIRLRQLLQRPDPLVMPAAFDVLSARIIETAGFDALLLSGSGVAASQLGVPDIGLAGLSEVVGMARNIARAVSVPVIADIDTGFGGLLNLRRAVQEMEEAGVAGVQLEDQVMPKRCGHLGTAEVVRAEEMVQKIEVVRQTRRDPEFYCVARTDALSGLGIEEALRRGKLYAGAGADAIFIEAPREVEQLRRIPKEIPAPCVSIVVEGGKSPVLDVADLAAMGFRILYFPGTAIISATAAMLRDLTELRKTGSVRKLAEQGPGFRKIQELVNLDEWLEFDRRFATGTAPSLPDEP